MAVCDYSVYSSPAQWWQPTCLPQFVPHAKVPADLSAQGAWADAGVSCEVSTERDHHLCGVGVEPAVSLAAKGAPSRALPGHLTAAITTHSVLIHRPHKLVAQKGQHLVCT